jgi:iron only hydrogenase large subunit-like protein
MCFVFSARNVYHVTVMPCYDKKLEAARPDFYDDSLHSRDVDCVLTTQEILDIIREKQIDFVTLPETPIPSLYLLSLSLSLSFSLVHFGNVFNALLSHLHLLLWLI